MWNMIGCLGFFLFAVGVFGSPYKKYELDNDNHYNADQFDVIYDQRQNGTENYKLNIDGLSLVWSPNSLLAAAALLEPALYGEYPDTSIDIILGPENKPEEKPILKPDSVDEKPIKEKPAKPVELSSEKPLESPDILEPTVLVIDENQLTGQKPSENTPGSSKRKIRLPALIRPFLRKRSSASTIPEKSTATIS